MYVKKAKKLFEVVQINGTPVHTSSLGREYTTMGPAQSMITRNHNQFRGNTHSYFEAWNDLNNFEIIEYEVIEKCRHKHPLARKE